MVTDLPDLSSNADLPESIQRDLLARYREPHRDYHGESHLRAGLGALEELGGGRLERIAYWCHDAVHSNTTPNDEHASVGVAIELIADTGTITDHELAEVVRLVLITIDHAPEPGDEAGARVSDADLVGLAYDWDAYARNIEGIRVELPQLGLDEWRERRRQTVTNILNRNSIYHTAYGRERWEATARANLERELAELT